MECDTCATATVKVQASASLVGRQAPNFDATAVMPDNTFEKLSLSSFQGQYVILLFYPMDFTFVCPTELVAFSKRLKEFKDQECQVIGISTDSEYTHLAWKNTHPEDGGLGPIGYPLVADITKSISRSYGVLHEESVALRGLFLIDKKGMVRHALVNDLSLGRSVDEAFRTLAAIKMIDTKGALCPVDWEPGDDTISTK